MKRILGIVRFNEDGRLAVGTDDLAKLDPYEYDFLTVQEFIEAVEATDLWNDIEPEVYEKALDGFLLDYSNYDDPAEMWEDFLAEVRRAKEIAEATDPIEVVGADIIMTTLKSIGSQYGWDKADEAYDIAWERWQDYKDYQIVRGYEKDMLKDEDREEDLEA